jgi:hypothetical protein
MSHALSSNNKGIYFQCGKFQIDLQDDLYIALLNCIQPDGMVVKLCLQKV